MEDTSKILLEIRSMVRTLLERGEGGIDGRGNGAALAGSELEPIAPDRVLDSKSGDPVIRAKPPRDWAGPSMVGKLHSDSMVGPDLLDMMADRHDFFASKADESGEMDNRGEKPKAYWERRSASLCRGWAERKRKNGWVKPEERPLAPALSNPFSEDDRDITPDEDDIPF